MGLHYPPLQPAESSCSHASECFFILSWLCRIDIFHQGVGDLVTSAIFFKIAQKISKHRIMNINKVFISFADKFKLL
jgi:hypothetical protein